MQQTIARRQTARRAAASVQLRRLTPNDLPAVVALDAELFPPAFRESVEQLHPHLLWPELKGENYSLGVFDGDRLVGYTLVVGRPSVFAAGERVLFVLRMAVRLKYRRQAVPALTQGFIRDIFLAGRHVEGRLRETTSLRTVKRYAPSFRKYGGRITGLALQEPIAGEQSIHFRAEHLIARDPVVWGAYQAVAGAARAARVAASLPRRALRKLCALLPAHRVPGRLRRAAYLELPQSANSGS